MLLCWLHMMMVKNLSMDQFFWINSHVNSLLELTFTLTRLFWHLLTLTCSICAMLAEWSEQLWTSQTLLPLHAVAWFLSIVWPPSESQLVAFCSWWRKWNTCTCILQRFNVIFSSTHWKNCLTNAMFHNIPHKWTSVSFKLKILQVLYVPNEILRGTYITLKKTYNRYQQICAICYKFLISYQYVHRHVLKLIYRQQADF